MMLFLLTCGSHNYGTVTCAVLAETEAQAIRVAAVADERFTPNNTFGVESSPVALGAALYSENNE